MPIIFELTNFKTLCIRIDVLVIARLFIEITIRIIPLVQ